MVRALTLFTILVPQIAEACPDCATSDEVWAQIQAHSPFVTLTVLVTAFAVVGGLIAIIARLASESRLFLGASLLLGAGLGAFIDGISLHQILQWHAMLSSVVVPVDLVSSKVNMFWDGVFHLLSWMATVAAVALLVRELPSARETVRSRVVLGGGLAGWGLFNLVEGTIDHQILGLHHVHPGAGQLAWDIGFLLSGVVLIAIGLAMALPPLRDRASVDPRRAPLRA